MRGRLTDYLQNGILMEFLAAKLNDNLIEKRL